MTLHTSPATEGSLQSAATGGHTWGSPPLTEDEFGVPVHHVRGADVHQLDATALERRQGRVYIVHMMHPHAPALALLLVAFQFQKTLFSLNWVVVH